MSAAPAVAPPPAIERRHVEGVSLLVREGRGRGTLVLLHGIGSDAASFAPLMKVFDPAWTMIAWDAPGYGRSDPLVGEWPSTLHYAAALARVLAGLGARPVALFGHSLGALMAAGVAVQRADLIDCLILSGPALGHGAERGKPLPEAVGQRLDDFKRLGPEAYAAERGPRLVHDADNRPEVTRAVVGAMGRLRLPGFAQASRLLATGRLLEDARRIQIPTLVLTGAEDIITPPSNAEQVLAALPADIVKKLVAIPACGHALPQEDPGAVARAVEAFLTSGAGPHG